MEQQPYKWMKLQEMSIYIDIKVIPNSSKNSVTCEEEYLKIKLTAPPVDNKANKALVEYLSKLLKIAKTSIKLKSGMTSKNKTIIIPKSALEKLETIINQ